MLKQLFLLPSVTLLAAVTGCNSDVPQQIQGSNADAKAEAVVRNPELASLALNGLSQVPPSEGSTGRVPGISVTLKDADYYKLLRCKASFVFTDAKGHDVRKTLADLTTTEKKNAWQRAEGDCAYVGRKIARAVFTDLTAGHTTLEQEFFYVLNPCVTLSTDHSESCSNQIAISENMRYTSPFAANFLTAAVNLNDLEDKLTAAFYQLNEIATATRTLVENCEDNNFHQKLDDRRKEGMFSIMKVGVSALVGGFIGGPAVAFVQSNGVLDGVLNFFKPKAGAIQDCSLAAEKYKVPALQLVEQDIPFLLTQVKNVRTNLNALNAGYAKLDVQHLDQDN